MEKRANQSLKRGLVAARIWPGKALGINPHERLNPRRKMAKAAVEACAVSSVFLEMCDPEVEADFACVATQNLREAVWMPSWHALLFEGGVVVDMQVVCPKNVKNMIKKSGNRSRWEEASDQT